MVIIHSKQLVYQRVLDCSMVSHLLLTNQWEFTKDLQVPWNWAPSTLMSCWVPVGYHGPYQHCHLGALAHFPTHPKIIALVMYSKSIYLPTYLSIYLSVYLSIYLSIFLSICLIIYMFLYIPSTYPMLPLFASYIPIIYMLYPLFPLLFGAKKKRPHFTSSESQLCTLLPRLKNSGHGSRSCLQTFF
jgi:hypothetical protein